MADYHHDPRAQQRPQRGYPDNGGHQQRDAAFSNIFGAAPSGRSQTMTSSSHPAMDDPHGRTATMGSQSGMQRQPPPRPHPGFYGEQQRTRTMDSNSAGGFYQGQRGPPGGYAAHPHQQHMQQLQHQQQQQQQQQQRQEQQFIPYQQPRRPYPPPQGPPPARGDPRGPPGPGARYPPPRPYQVPPPGNDSYRSQSLVSQPRPQMYNPPPSAYQQPAANQFRQAPYSHQGQSRTTAQGRVVPERHHEDRSMSMTGTFHPQDRDAHQTMSGRVIPNRRAPSAELPAPNGFGSPNGSNGQGRTTSMSNGTADHNRSMSMASTIAPTIVTSESDASTAIAPRPMRSRSIESERPTTATKIRPPLVYPAMLSKVGECFRRKIITGDRTKNELTYKNAFSGSEAVDVLSYIIRTTDRNLALLLGRSLDAQKYFHDVTYEHRLRDSQSEMYQFRENLMEEQPDDTPAVNGVFVLLSECYSPTCTKDQLCYSIACPRRLEQVSRLNLKINPGLSKQDDPHVNDDEIDQTDEQKLWINSVPKEIAEKVDEREKKRQEVISEICYTERDFVKDLEYLRDFWILPLRSKASPIPATRRDKVVKTIFSNITDHPSIHSVSSRFASALTSRQQKEPIVHNIGDKFLEFVPQFEPFIWYGSRQLEGKYEFENERSINPFFGKFVDEIERRKESRKLELNGYLTKPTTRLARYPLLLENVLKYTEDGNPDKEDIPKVLVVIRDLLGRVNAESGKAENRFNLRKLHDQLRFRPNERVDLRLTEEGRELVFKSQFKKSPTDPTEFTAFLFDHAVLLVRVKQTGKTEEIKAYRRPIPLELLSIKEMEEVIPQGGVKRSSSSLIPLRNADQGKKGEGWPITFRHLGKAGYEVTVYAANQAARKKWLEYIDSAQQRLRARADFFNTTVMSSSFFVGSNRINCATPFDGGRKLLFGTDNGIYVSERKNKDQVPRRVLEITSVTQVDVLEEYQLLLVLSNKTLVSFNTSALNPDEPAMSKRPKKIQNHCSFFKTGICLGRHLVCCVKSSALSTTIKVYEPTDAMTKVKKQKGLGKFIAGGQDELKSFKEFYIPTESTSVHFLKSKLCVACARGFEVVSLETLETQSLLDQADTSLDFVARKEGVRPIHIERLNGEFLLNYSEFSFFVNRNGWRARPEWRIDWEGAPSAFALSYPWIIAFELNFIELRNMENGAVHIVPHKNIRMLHSSTHEILFAWEDERGEDVVEAIDFWKSNRRSDMLGLPPA